MSTPSTSTPSITPFNPFNPHNENYYYEPRTTPLKNAPELTLFKSYDDMSDFATRNHFSDCNLSESWRSRTGDLAIFIQNLDHTSPEKPRFQIAWVDEMRFQISIRVQHEKDKLHALVEITFKKQDASPVDLNKTNAAINKIKEFYEYASTYGKIRSHTRGVETMSKRLGDIYCAAMTAQQLNEMMQAGTSDKFESLKRLRLQGTEITPSFSAVY